MRAIKMLWRLPLIALALLLATPGHAHATARSPLVIINGQIQQLPAGNNVTAGEATSSSGTVYRPLVVITGRIQNLPIGDTLTVGAGGTTYRPLVMINGQPAVLPVGSSVQIGASTVTADATSTIKIPQTAEQWISLSDAEPPWSPPANLWLCQEASGNLADTIGGVTLTKGGSPTYQGAVTGWSTKGLGFTQVGNQGFSSATGGVSDPGDSTASLTYVKVTGDSANRVIATIAGANLAIFVNASGQLLISAQNQTAVHGTFDYRDGNVHPLILRHNEGAQVTYAITDKEIVKSTWGTVTTGQVAIGAGAATGAAPPTAQILYRADWDGDGAEAIGANTLVNLGWTLAYSASTDTGTSKYTHLIDTTGGVTRSYPNTIPSSTVHVLVPNAWRYDTVTGPYPVIFLLHGAGSDQDGIVQLYNLGTNFLNSTLPQLDTGYIFVDPLGSQNAGSGPHYWNADLACCAGGGAGATTGINDTGYLEGLYQQVKTNFGTRVDTTKIFSGGHSNGAFMTWTLLCADGNDFVAGMATSGSVDIPTQACPHAQNVSSALYASTADATFTYGGNGSPTGPYSAGFMGAVNATTGPYAVGGWGKWFADQNTCTGTLQPAYATGITLTTAGAVVSQQAYSSCPATGAVEVWTATAGGHNAVWAANAYDTFVLSWLNGKHR